MTTQPRRRRFFGPFPRLYLGAAITLAVVALAIVSRFWTPHSPTRLRVPLRLKPPLEAGLAGTDAFGRDIFSQLMMGAWNSLSIAVLAVVLGVVVGVALGTLAAAWRGRWVEEVVMRFCDVVFSFPALISAIMIAALVGSGAATAIVAIGLFNVPVFARVANGMAQPVWEQAYCLAARAAGKGRLRITLDHVLPNIAGGITVQATIQTGLAILVEAGLSFLGLSLAPPAPSWGRMLSDAQTYLGQAPWMAIAPGLAVAIAVLGFNLLGDGLRDKLDPGSEARA
ncbi:MAG: ABC transporter permease [Ottowia sp.]|nr:ABC transporter permease [Ottowia sp.]